MDPAQGLDFHHSTLPPLRRAKSLDRRTTESVMTVSQTFSQLHSAENAGRLKVCPATYKTFSEGSVSVREHCVRGEPFPNPHNGSVVR